MTVKKPANQYLRALLAEAAWTGQQFARAVNSVAAENGVQARYDRTSVAHWLRGVVPRPRVRVLAAEALGRRLGRLVTPVDLGWAAESPDVSSAEQQDWPPDAVTRLTHLCRADTDPLQGPRLHWSVYQAIAAAPQRHVPVPYTYERDVPSTQYPVDTGALVLGTAIPFFSMALEIGGTHARMALAAYLGSDVPTGLRKAIPRPQSRSLVTDAARLLYLLARMHSDDAHDGLAQRYFRVAFELAGTVNDSTTQATVLRAMSNQAGALRHIGASLALAEHACELLPSSAPPGVHAFVTSQQAVALALAGQKPAARTALHRAEAWQQQRESATPTSPCGSTPADFSTYTPAAWCFQRGRTLVALGERTAAAAAFRTSLAHRSPHAHRARALTQAALTRLLLQTGHVDEACASYHELLDIAPYPQSARVRQALLDLKRMLRPFGKSPAVRRLLEHAEHVSR
ncbi:MULTISPECIES: hypothetical protein [unclassified Streptomyces]|uniref:hypothetical protein n=1 Tax=unclassified Streptomyces TaxID=2593676 RepID=UPI001CBA96F2|nr:MULTISPECIES: hypothetical protein [unclassified Streptomyces]WPO70465.1 hypothetical protein R9806_07410 [Streptomyces sp. KN37]